MYTVPVCTLSAFYGSKLVDDGGRHMCFTPRPPAIPCACATAAASTAAARRRGWRCWAWRAILARRMWTWSSRPPPPSPPPEVPQQPVPHNLNTVWRAVRAMHACMQSVDCACTASLVGCHLECRACSACDVRPPPHWLTWYLLTARGVGPYVVCVYLVTCAFETASHSVVVQASMPARPLRRHS
jgi:hypothetical protein